MNIKYPRVFGCVHAVRNLGPFPTQVLTILIHFSLVILISIAASLSTLGANIYLPVLSDVAKDVNSTPQVVSLTVTCFMYGTPANNS